MASGLPGVDFAVRMRRALEGLDDHATEKALRLIWTGFEDDLRDSLMPRRPGHHYRTVVREDGLLDLFLEEDR